MTSTMYDSLEIAYRAHLTRVGLVLKEIFQRDPKQTVDRLSAYYGSLPDTGRYEMLHDGPLGLAIGWGKLSVPPNDPQVLRRYRELQKSEAWKAAEDTASIDQTKAVFKNLTAELVAAYVGGNQVSAEQLPRIIAETYRNLVNAARQEPEAPKLDKPIPAVPVKKSVHPDYIICLEDGKKLKMLKRYLRTTYNMTPEEYRKRWGLPADYPMVAPSYAQGRSVLAKKIGLGRGKPKKVRG